MPNDIASTGAEKSPSRSAEMPTGSPGRDNIDMNGGGTKGDGDEVADDSGTSGGDRYSGCE